METNNSCISCIKDGVTGVCRDIKDKKAREDIALLQRDLATISGVDGGHLATDEDVANLQSAISQVRTDLENEATAFDTDIAGINSRVDALEGSNTATGTTIASMQSQVDTNTRNVASNTADINSLSTIVNGVVNNQATITGIVEKIIEDHYVPVEGDTLNTDNPTNVTTNSQVATNTENITNLQGRVTTLEDNVNALTGTDGGHLATDGDISNLQGQINDTNTSLSSVSTQVDTNTANISNVTTTLNEVVETVNGLSGTGGGVTLKSATYSNLADFYASVEPKYKNGSLHRVVLNAKSAYYNGAWTQLIITKDGTMTTTKDVGDQIWFNYGNNTKIDLIPSLYSDTYNNIVFQAHNSFYTGNCEMTFAISSSSIKMSARKLTSQGTSIKIMTTDTLDLTSRISQYFTLTVYYFE